MLAWQRFGRPMKRSALPLVRGVQGLVRLWPIPRVASAALKRWLLQADSPLRACELAGLREC